MFFEFEALQLGALRVGKLGHICNMKNNREIKNVDISLDQRQKTALRNSNPRAWTLTILGWHALFGAFTNQNNWYFIRPMQKTRLSENRTQSMHPDKQGALINRKIKNVDISLDQSKKTIPPKVCTLTILGLHALARWRSRQNCWKTIGFTTLRAPHSRWRKWRHRSENTPTDFS